LVKSGFLLVFLTLDDDREGLLLFATSATAFPTTMYHIIEGRNTHRAPLFSFLFLGPQN